MLVNIGIEKQKPTKKLIKFQKENKKKNCKLENTQLKLSIARKERIMHLPKISP